MKSWMPRHLEVEQDRPPRLGHHDQDRAHHPSRLPLNWYPKASELPTPNSPPPARRPARLATRLDLHLRTPKLGPLGLRSLIGPISRPLAGVFILTNSASLRSPITASLVGMAVVEILSIEDVCELLRDVDAATVDPETVDPDCLASMVLGAQSLQNWLESRLAVLLAEFALSGLWAADGSRSVAAWVEERSHSPATRVAAQAKLGLALRSMPITRAAALAGELSQPHVRLLASCRSDATAELFDRDEAQLVEWARSMRLREFKPLVAVWAAHARPRRRHARRTRPREGRAAVPLGIVERMLGLERHPQP